jgi:hypothetical protein
MTDTSYHIAKSGRIARCKAEAGKCPLGSKHFADKKVAQFYREQDWGKLSEQEAAVAKHFLKELPRQDLSDRLGLLDTHAQLLRNRNRVGVKQAMQQLVAAGYDKDDQSWNHDLLLGELQRRIAIERVTPGSLEYTWQKRLEGYEQLKALPFDEVNRRVTQLERAVQAAEAGDTSLFQAYTNGFALMNGYDPASPAWQLAPLKAQQQENMRANAEEHAKRDEAIRTGVPRP